MKYWQYEPTTKEVDLSPFLAIFRGGIYHLPQHSITFEPLPQKKGYAVLLSNQGNKTEYVEDHRGVTVFSQSDGHAIEITELGPLPETDTEQKPTTAFDEWIDGQWVTNLEKQYQYDYNQVDDIRRALFTQNVDPLLVEANVKKIQGLEKEATLYIQQALALRKKIQDEHPWPSLPQESTYGME